MSFISKLTDWETEFQTVIRPMREDDDRSHLYAGSYASHLEDLHAIVQAHLKSLKDAGAKKEIKLSKPWTSPHTGQTRVYVNGLGLGEGYKVFFFLDDFGALDCRLTLPREVWQDQDLRTKEQARFDEMKGELIATYRDVVVSQIATDTPKTTEF